ncbi:hypothetical protein GJ688_13325 [Heliobacillus mobilis]|uniref:SLH domain-containing protein n=2 Tax=Heliobacterium mobile TaxID=28064 RepID=A0A6I3SMJ4_HELMO|nr:hypothetical protein [Heliobacterium mobile]
MGAWDIFTKGLGDEAMKLLRTKWLASGLIVLLLVAMLPLTAFAQTRFVDADEIPSWASPSVQDLVDSKMLSGYADGRFAPSDLVTYEQVITGIFNVLWLQDQAAGLSQSMAALPNVSPWAQGYVQLAKQRDIMKSPNNNSPIPAPNDYTQPANRAWVAAFLAMTLGYDQWQWDLNNRIPFTDMESIPVDLRMMVNTAADLGLASGMGITSSSRTCPSHVLNTRSSWKMPRNWQRHRPVSAASIPPHLRKKR